MAVLSVKEDWRELAANLGPEEATAPRKFTVLFDNVGESANPINRPFLAQTANDGTTKIPSPWEPHPYKPWLFVRNIEPKAVGPFLFEVYVYYATIPLQKRETNYDPTISPLDQPWEVEWSFAEREQQIDKDVNGKPIVNSAKESFDPAITTPVADLILRITRPQSFYDPIFAAQYINCTNSDNFKILGLTFEPGVAKINNFGDRWARAAGLFYHLVNYEFQFRYGWWNEQTKLYEKWLLSLYDAGYIQNTGSAEVPKYENIKINGERPSEPWPLDGAGHALTDKQKRDGVCYFLTFQNLRSRPFSALGFNI
jgi:hypothetical protein